MTGTEAVNAMVAEMTAVKTAIEAAIAATTVGMTTEIWKAKSSKKPNLPLMIFYSGLRQPPHLRFTSFQMTAVVLSKEIWLDLFF